MWHSRLYNIHVFKLQIQLRLPVNSGGRNSTQQQVLAQTDQTHGTVEKGIPTKLFGESLYSSPLLCQDGAGWGGPSTHGEDGSSNKPGHCTNDIRRVYQGLKSIKFSEVVASQILLKNVPKERIV